MKRYLPRVCGLYSQSLHFLRRWEGLKQAFEINILNTNQIVHSMEELVPIAGMIVH